VFLEAGEGALDLKLSAKNIMLLASKFGQPAGRALIEKFISGAPAGRPSGFWDEHRWVRFNTWLTGLRERIEGITAATERAGFGKPLKQQIAEAMEKRPLAGNDADDPAGAKLTPAQADDLRILLAALQDLELKFSQAQLPQPYKPVPTPSLRIRAPL